MTHKELDEYLNKANNIKKVLDYKHDLIEVLKAKANRVTPVLSDMPRVQVYEQDGMANCVAEIVDLQRETVELRNQYLSACAELLNLFYAITTGKQREVLDNRYIEGLTTEETKVKMGIDCHETYRTHMNRARLKCKAQLEFEKNFLGS